MAAAKTPVGVVQPTVCQGHRVVVAGLGLADMPTERQLHNHQVPVADLVMQGAQVVQGLVKHLPGVVAELVERAEPQSLALVAQAEPVSNILNMHHMG